jgi:hypothetical protein
MDDDLASEFFKVSAAWHGRSDERMTTNQAITRLNHVASQAENPGLAGRARLLLDQIVYGRNHRPARIMTNGRTDPRRY